MAVSAARVTVPSNYVSVGGLKVHPRLAEVVKETVLPGTGTSPTYFWTALRHLTEELRPELVSCLSRRDELQYKIDLFYKQQMGVGANFADMVDGPACKAFLTEIGYIEPDQGPTVVSTQFTDNEIARTPAPQIVVPSDNGRYVLNAVNARWGSLFDALYGFDVIPVSPNRNEGGSIGYNPMRGEEVIAFANDLLDEIAPLTTGRWSEVVRLWPTSVGDTKQLELQLNSGAHTSLQTPSLFVGFVGSLGPPDPRNAAILNEIHATTPSVADKGRIILKHNNLHVILEIDRDDRIGKSSPSGIKDIIMESAVSAILDMEDSVSAVDGEDKAKIYSNIVGVFKGTLEVPFIKDGMAITRRLASDILFRDTSGNAAYLPGRAICLVRNVGHHMFTDSVLLEGGIPVPEGFLDCLVTVVAALHDLRGTSQFCNSRTGSIYIVKPKMHGPREVRLTSRVFGRAEELFGLRRNTVKMGIMDEERRTSANLRECVRAASSRVFFINTGFLDRTGDEIHTCMHAGPVCKKGDMKQQPWIKAYEDANVDVGLFAGFQGKGQIGKGMWPKPDSMMAMLESKISEVMAGASTAWVPSPAAATLHSIHYHRVDVVSRQMQLAMRPPAKVETILGPPLLGEALPKEAIAHDLRENAQSILGYVVRWVDSGVGCSKVPDLSNVGLMEDRATLRISSQLLANWLQHGLISEQEIRTVFKEMAKLVDQQNASDRAYRPMSGNLDTNIAFQAALELVLRGSLVPNGYTEYTLHAARRQVKQAIDARL